MGFLAWIVVGLIAGWLAGQVMKGGGYGILVDIILGILGGILGGWVFGLLGIWPGGGMIGSIIVAFVGAVILVEMMIEFLLRHSYGLWHFKTGKPDAVLPQGNSCQEKHTQLRLPLVD